MTRSFSLYLDAVRFLAAFVVLLHHAKYLYNPGYFIFSFGQEAVVIFFVLSGYVIAYVADKKEHTLREYSISRLSRVYSVALPAIVLTGLFDYFGYTLNAAVYPPGAQAWDSIPLRVTASLLFLNQTWFVSIQPFSNVPYWSLCYEVWYYIGFALLTYVGGRRGWLAFLGIAVLVGPKIILLMPVWWAGVFLYRSQALRHVSERLGWLLLLISIAGLAGYVEGGVAAYGKGFLPPLVGPEFAREFASSQRFVADYALAACIAINFVGVRAICARRQEVSGIVEFPIRALAASTFTLYLLHKPLIFFYAAILDLQEVSVLDYVIALFLILVTTLLIARYTEQKKHIWKKWISNLFDFLDHNISKMFGTFRGFVRLVIANGLWALGPYRKYEKIDFGRVRRLIFVCQGNICRSPFGHHLAAKIVDGIPVRSLGLGTTSGLPANTVATEAAGDFGVDLADHRTTALSDFTIADGDLFLVMEDRHMRALRPYLVGHDAQIGLLGLWCRPRFALLYDPHRLSRNYFTTCFQRISRAVEALKFDLDRGRSASSIRRAPEDDPNPYPVA